MTNISYRQCNWLLRAHQLCIQHIEYSPFNALPSLLALLIYSSNLKGSFIVKSKNMLPMIVFVTHALLARDPTVCGFKHFDVGWY